MAVLSLKSLLRFVPDLAVVIHGDDSFDHSCCATIREQIPGCRVVTAAEADRVAQGHPDVQRYREAYPARFSLGPGFEHHRRGWTLKIFDFHLHSKTDRIICLDSDTLFLKPPLDPISWLHEENPPCFYPVPYLPNLYVAESRLATLFPGVRILRWFNSGFIGFRKSQIPLNRLVEISSLLHGNADVPIFGDECIWRYAFSEVPTRQLPFVAFPIFGGKRRFVQFSDIEHEFVYIHFLLKHRAGLYTTFARRVISELPHDTPRSMSRNVAIATPATPTMSSIKPRARA